MNVRLLVSLLALVAGCGSTTSPAAQATGTATSELVGRWKSACTPSQPSQWFVLDFDIAASTWKLDYAVYGDAACTSKFLTVHIEGPYEVGAASSVPGARDAKFAFTKKTVTPHVADAAAFLSGDTGCKEAGFAPGVAKDITESGCAGLGQYPLAKCPADYDVVKVEGDGVTFGARPADNDMCTPEKRPKALAPLTSKRQ